MSYLFLNHTPPIDRHVCVAFLDLIKTLTQTNPRLNFSNMICALWSLASSRYACNRDREKSSVVAARMFVSALKVRHLRGRQEGDPREGGAHCFIFPQDKGLSNPFLFYGFFDYAFPDCFASE